MVDNVTLNAGTGGDSVAADDIGGVKFQRTKVTFGVDGVAVDVSAANPLPVTDGLAQAVTNAQLRASGLPVQLDAQVTTLWVTTTAATGVAATATLPAAGAGLFHYITHIDIQLYATAARTGAAAPVLVTSANLPGAPAWGFPTAQVIGAIDRYDVPLLTPLKSSVANTATSIVAPIATTGLWRINIGYYTGP